MSDVDDVYLATGMKVRDYRGKEGLKTKAGWQILSANDWRSDT